MPVTGSPSAAAAPGTMRATPSIAASVFFMPLIRLWTGERSLGLTHACDHDRVAAAALCVVERLVGAAKDALRLLVAGGRGQPDRARQPVGRCVAEAVNHGQRFLERAFRKQEQELVAAVAAEEIGHADDLGPR